MRLIAAALSALLLLTACSSSGSGAPAKSNSPESSSAAASPSAEATFSISGSLTLYGEISTGVDSMKNGDPCIGISNPNFPSENFEDIAEGTDLKVTDGSGATVGVGQLTGGVFDLVNPLTKRVCRFDYRVDGITGGKGFYKLSIGDHDTKTYAEGEFRGGIGNLAFTSALYDG